MNIEEATNQLYEVIDDYSNLDGADGIYDALKRWLEKYTAKVEEKVLSEKPLGS